MNRNNDFVMNTTALHLPHQPMDASLKLLENISITHDVCVLVFETPDNYPLALPGQFVNIHVSESYTPLLRRPFSIHRAVKNRLEVLLKVVGQGTQMLYETPPGSFLQVIGPLGNSFEIEGDYSKALLVSGGIGIGPMALLESVLKDHGKAVYNFIGGRTRRDIIKRELSNIYVSTDDGLEGFRGNVIELLEQELSQFSTRDLRIFACGPTPMLKALKTFCLKNQLECFLSLETFMGCGIGICYGCSVRTQDEDGHVHNDLLCQCGPVVKAQSVIFED